MKRKKCSHRTNITEIEFNDPCAFRVYIICWRVNERMKFIKKRTNKQKTFAFLRM